MFSSLKLGNPLRQFAKKNYLGFSFTEKSSSLTRNMGSVTFPLLKGGDLGLSKPLGSQAWLSLNICKRYR